MTKQVRGEKKKFVESKENENAIYQNLWYTAKDMLRGIFVDISAFINKMVTSQINILYAMMPIKLLEKQEQNKPKISRQREIIKIRAEINEIDTKKLCKESVKQ
jgi:hypothetical protein